MHHISIRTAEIHRAIAFYEILGFQVSDRFTAGYTLACWLMGADEPSQGLTGRLELIQIPEPKPAPDAFYDEHYVGYYHISFDLSALCAAQAIDLPIWLAQLSDRLAAAQLPYTVLLAPQQQQIGDRIYEVAFIADLDGLPLEFIRQL